MRICFPFADFWELWKEEDQGTDHQADLFPLEELVGARRVDRDPVIFQITGECNRFGIFHRTEEERDLVPIGQMSLVAKGMKEIREPLRG